MINWPIQGIIKKARAGVTQRMETIESYRRRKKDSDIEEREKQEKDKRENGRKYFSILFFFLTYKRKLIHDCIKFR